VSLSDFLRAGIGDCRMSALTLAIALRELEDLGRLYHVEYENRKWGFHRLSAESGRPTEAVGLQGEHAIVTFSYKKPTGGHREMKYVADAYAVPFDRVPVGGLDGVDVIDDWYKVDETRVTGTANNVYRQLLRDGIFDDDLVNRMSEDGARRFREQATMLAQDEKDVLWGYMSTKLNHPTIILPRHGKARDRKTYRD